MNQKLTDLREQLTLNNIEGFLFTTNDEYINEYISNYAERVKFLTNFTGSAAFVIVLTNTAAIFVDGRYTEQVKTQVDSSLFNILDYTLENIKTWVYENTKENSKIAINTKTTSIAEFKLYESILSPHVSLVNLSIHLVDNIWKSQPKKTNNLISLYLQNYAGLSAVEKINLVTGEMLTHNLDYILFSKLDSIAWLLNLRGTDIPNSPLFFASALLNKNKKLILFTNSTFEATQLNEIQKYCEVLSESSVESILKNITTENKVNVRLSKEAPVYYLTLLTSANVSVSEDIVSNLKLHKNSTEIIHAFNSHIKDGVALTKLLYTLHTSNNISEYSEISVAETLENIKNQINSTVIAENVYKSASFNSIIGANGNGSIVHYRASELTNKNLTNNSIVLMDTGGQYLGSTTDVTRTITISNAHEIFKRHFTLVLKSHIALANLVFKEGTLSSAIDVLSRQFLWAEGLDYNHGTGHGVGSYLSVHEGIGISSKGNTPLKAGMIISVEPGIYITNEYGIRLENLYVITNKSNGFLEFTPLTLVPFDCKNILLPMLNSSEIKWLENYNNMLTSKISQYLAKEELLWLKSYTTFN